MPTILLLLFACGPTRTADAWLSDLEAGRDADALAKMDLRYGTPAGFDAVKLGKRADRFSRILREHDPVEWTSVTRRRPEGRPNDPGFNLFVNLLAAIDRRYELEGILRRGELSRTLSLQVHSGRVYDVQVGGGWLVPHDSYHVIPLPESDEAPVLRDLALGWEVYGGTRFVRSTGAIHTDGSRPGVTLTATCREGERFYRSATMSGHLPPPGPDGWMALELSNRVGNDVDGPCELELEVASTERRRATWCLTETGFAGGPCPVQPTPGRTSDALATFEDIEVDLDGNSTQVSYTFHPNEPLPEPYGDVSATIVTEVECVRGALDRHTRPIRSDWVEPGVHRRLGSVLISDDPELVPPCDVRLRFVWDDRYDRIEQDGFVGCFDRGQLVDGPC